MKYIALLLLFCSSVYADSIIKYGVAVPKNGESKGATKAIFLTYQDHWFGPFIKQYEGGYWADSVGNGRSSSLMGSASFGVNVNAGVVFTQALVGPAYISNPDTILGGPLQFNNDFALGLRDSDTGNTIGFAYKHISSAGIYHPNMGRDFLLLRVGVNF